MSEENLYTFENPQYRKTFWHTSSLVMAQAVSACGPTSSWPLAPPLTKAGTTTLTPPSPSPLSTCRPSRQR